MTPPPELQITLQKVVLLVLGRGATQAEINVIASMSGDNGDWRPLIDVINACMNEQAQAKGTVKLLKETAQNGMGMELTDTDANAVAGVLKAGYFAWSDIVISCLADQSLFGKTLENRAIAAFDFSQKIEIAGKTQYFAQAQDNFNKILHTIDASQASLDVAKASLSEFIDNGFVSPVPADDLMKPTAQEQLALELVNRARLDPLAEAQRYGIDLNEGLAPGTISADVKMPLAMNAQLIDSARAHSSWMLENDVFSHTGKNGSDPGDRMKDAAYVFAGSWGWGENIAWWGTSTTVDATKAMANHHKGLFLSEGHRVNILDDEFTEVGMGQELGEFKHEGQSWNTSMLTQNFATTGDRSNFVTGAVFRDTDADAFYSVGEGLGNITVTVGGKSAVTYGAGGYAVANVQGTPTVKFSGPALASPVSATLTMPDSSVKIDLMNDSVVRSSASITLGDGATGLVLLGNALSGVGNAQDNHLQGNGTNNVLIGNGGNDTLTGGMGKDAFVFFQPGEGVDTLTDFQSGVDTIQIMGSNFGLKPGELVTLRVSTAPAPQGRVAQFLYDTATGSLAFDSDGAGANSAVQLATLLGVPPLAATDILVVNEVVSEVVHA